MQLLSYLLVCTTLVTRILAQVDATLAFTSVPGVAVAGQSYNITWVGGSGQPVTLLLKEGPAYRLTTVQVIGDNISGYSYLWTVSRTVASNVDYSLQILQGQGSIGYSGSFSIVGGTGTLSINAPGITLPPSANSSLASASSAAAANMTSNAATPSMNMTMTMAANSTMMNSTTSRMNSTSMAATMASMTSSMMMTSSAMSSGMSSGATGGAAGTGGSATTGATSTPVQTNFPTVTTGPGAINVPPQLVSFAALMLGVVGAVMGMN